VRDESVDGGVRTDMDTVYTASRLPGSFSGVRNLQRYSGRSEGEVEKLWLLKTRTRYTNPREFVFRDAKPIRKKLVTYFTSIWWICRVCRHSTMG